MPLAPGDRFDRYVIEEPLGEGGMARVYRAHDPRLNRRVALKVLRLDPSGGADATDLASSRVLREARAAAALDHPNAVSVFDVGEAEERLFIAMELVVGKSLRAFVGDDTVRWETKLRWMVDAARALGAAHERGLVHRDVKPENMMVRGDGVVKVLDFGIAKRVVPEVPGLAGGDARTLSIHGGIVGTPWYLSPEQLRGEAVDGRADQFAWAVTTYELLTGHLPWPKGVDGFQLVLAILQAIPEPPSRAMGGLPSVVDATIVKALAKAAPQRFEDMEAVVSALEPYVATSRRNWTDVPFAATTKTDPAPPMPDRSSGSAPPALPSLAGGATTQPSTGDATTLPGPRTPPRTLARPAAVATVLIAAATAIAFASARLTRSPPHAATVSTPQPTSVTDLPSPPGGPPEAVAAYRAFLGSFRDADWEAAMTSLKQAVDRDPSMAAAQLRLAYMRSLESIDEGLVRTTFKQAARNRASLTERDAALLDALEPYLQRNPSDPLDSERRLEALRKRWPLDAELAYLLASVRFDRGDLAAAVEAFDAAIAIDPSFALAWSTKGGCLAYLGRFADAREALAGAEHASHTATEALWYRAEIDEQEGLCADEEADVRTWLSRDPDDWYAYHWLGRALAAEGKPTDAVRTALEQKWVRVEAEKRGAREAIDRALLDMVAGDFASAEKRLLALEESLASEPGAQAHAEPSVLLLRIAEETGRADRARAIAEGFLARKDAWTAPHRVDDVSIFLDPVPEMLGALSRAGVLTAAQLAEQRGEWLHTWSGKTAPPYRGYLWIAGWAAPATTPEEATDALRALPEFGNAPAFSPTVPAASYAGRVYRLAGRTGDAVEALRRGTATCTLLSEPMAHTRGWLDLGLALEAQGDTAGACAAYRVPIARWGHAKPRSLTADQARARVAALGCR
jgi:serine/threonine-protein kinase